MFTISQRKYGKSTIYIRNNEEGRFLVNQITSKFPDASARIRPLLNGKIAVDVYDEKGAAQLIDALLIAHQKGVDERKRARWDAQRATYASWLARDNSTIDDYGVIWTDDYSAPLAKGCTKCGQVKPIDEFYAHKTGRAGRRPDCKDCVRKRVNAVG
ncbi:hypothetical protein [Paenibacillus brasilensis]|uniref:Phage protein n=1 Tax=Paenibacillus brasilensis TaxID=128574 RepID=A0ABU0KS59_9BACL|nr:hypothetical protein [Paenibacillus brasilensis]MDQ0492273.1 hypothetical protein [Paenibacillus brasilensis]